MSTIIPRVLMLSSNNILSPADGRPMVTPTQDMIIGGYYLTELRQPAGEHTPRHFSRVHQLEHAMEVGDVDLHEPIVYRSAVALRGEDGEWEPTTPGRVLFNETLPADFGFVNTAVRKREMGQLVRDLSDRYGKAIVAESLDAIKNLCYRYASQSGLTISIDDVRTPPTKGAILDRYEADADKVEAQYRRGIITDGERRQKEVDIWTSATEEITAAMEAELKATMFNPIEMMVGSGARGNMMQVRQIAGIRGLVANPRGDIIPRPIKSSYREGLSMLEYFISTPGARKGLVDTALRTADSGYLTRRLVDVAQELIVNEDDPFDTGSPVRGVWLENVKADGWYDRDSGEPAQPGDANTSQIRTYLETRLLSRTLTDDVQLSDGTTVEAGTLVDEDLMETLRDDPAVTRLRVLSPLTDDSPYGVSSKGYGGSLATGNLIEVGEAVGVIAAQSIGEPGTQLTMRTFHTGGVAGSDIAGGLPRVVELFEARSPKGKAVLARTSGVVRIGEDDGRGRLIEIISDDGEEEAYTVPSIARLAVTDGQDVRAGDALVEGPRDPKELLEIRGVAETQAYLVEEVQKVYRDQGVSIHDKHIELIVRQMTRRVQVVEAGESEFLPGQQVDARVFREENRRLVEEGKTPAEARPVIMGITKASLATDSWLSAASFQETTRVLTEAAIESKSDTLRGLKENIIIGKLIPAGTGIGMYRHVETSAPDFQPMEFWTSEEDEDPAAYLAALQGGFDGDAVPATNGNGEVIGNDSA